jgi:hypothetical protein
MRLYGFFLSLVEEAMTPETGYVLLAVIFSLPRRGYRESRE